MNFAARQKKLAVAADYMAYGIESHYHQERALEALAYLFYTGDTERGIKPIRDAKERLTVIWGIFRKLARWDFKSCARQIFDSIVRRCFWTKKDDGETLTKKTKAQKEFEKHVKHVEKIKAANAEKSRDSQERIRKAFELAKQLGIQPSMRWIINRGRASYASVKKFMEQERVFVANDVSGNETQSKAAKPLAHKPVEVPKFAVSDISKDLRSSREDLDQDIIGLIDPSRYNERRRLNKSVNPVTDSGRIVYTAETLPDGYRSAFRPMVDNQTGELVMQEIHEPSPSAQARYESLINKFPDIKSPLPPSGGATGNGQNRHFSNPPQGGLLQSIASILKG